MGVMRTNCVLALCAAVLSTAVARPQSIVIDEIHYDPADKTVPEEFVELYNHGDTVADLSGWYFSDGIEFTFPDGVTIEAGAYLVVAQDPDTLVASFGDVPVVGPFSGRLSNDGESVVLRDADGFRRDKVDFRRGYPWPTVGSDAGFSIELIHPDLDNDLGGNWRASNPGADDSADLVRASTTWGYREGTEEPSSPRSAWRAADFDDADWSTGRAPIGYGEGIVRTELGDMRGSYTSIALRQTFDVENLAAARTLTLEVVYDDGFNAWINGTWVAGDNLSSNDLAFDGTANSALEDLDFNAFALADPSDYLVEGENVLAIQLFNASLGGSSDAFIDARLTSASRGGSGPTPGAQNSVFSFTLPPTTRQVDHAPKQPHSDEDVVISVKATDLDGVASVELEYQIVEPGTYFSVEDAEYDDGWTPLAMNDAGVDGDLLADDDTWTVTVPAGVQLHRRLVRYRIRATDTVGHSVQVPYADDPQPNFAYFVWDGAPTWSAAIQPGSSNEERRRVVDYPLDVMNSLPTFHLITRVEDTEDCTWFSRYGGSDYLWTGTLVHDGEVYDPVHYRARGGVWRYAMGKNMWKFDFTRGHGLVLRDDWNRKYDHTVDKLNFSAVIQQGNFRHRGEQGLFESTGFRLFNLMGVESPKTQMAQFRIIDDADEHGATQYDGDFWGLYVVIEQMDGRFLDEHELPDGNFYKMEGGSGTLNNQGPTAATDRSDLNAFLSTYQNTTPSDAWWRENLDLPRYYSYRCVVEGIHHYDIAGGKNYFYYLNPELGQWSVLPWDLDLTWADNMFGSGNEPFKSRVLTRSAFSIEYKNRMREFRDLLYNPDQMNPLIDEYAAIIESVGPSMVDADRSKWDYHPVLADGSLTNSNKAGHGRFYERAPTHDFFGMAQILKNYVISRGNWIDTNIARDTAIPNRPTIDYVGPDGFPIDALAFESGAFRDPQGSGTFGAMMWRIGEVAAAGTPPWSRDEPRPHEIETVWESDVQTAFAPRIEIPAAALEIGARYRARVRMMDDSGRWSRWSTASEFTAGEPTVPFPQQSFLRVTEIHYHPAADEDDEFIELHNIGAESIDLRDVSFTDGIEFDFRDGAVTTLDSGEFVVLVRDLAVFSSRHDVETILVAGEYRGALSNAGERIALRVGANTTILDFEFDDAWYPTTDGLGHSLVIIDPEEDPNRWGNPDSWNVSDAPGGSPGAPDGGPPPGGRRRTGDSNGDGRLDVSDSVSLLRRLFVDGALPLPCDGASLEDGGNLLLFDVEGNGAVGVGDAIRILDYLFRAGPAPAGGTQCLRIPGCPSACSP